MESLPYSFFERGSWSDHSGYVDQDQADAFPQQTIGARGVRRRTGLSRNTIRNGFRQETIAEPKYPARTMPSIVDLYRDQLDASLRSDRHLPKRDQRTVRVIFEMLQAQGYPDGYGRIVASSRQ